MQLSRLLFRIALLVFPVALIGTTWLYLYPIFQGCAFPAPRSTHAHSIAPFRLLSLGDPQLEGDSSLPDPNRRVFPAVESLVPNLRDANDLTERREILTQAAKDVLRDARRWLNGKRKAIDLWGNDRYLAHIVRSLTWWTEPTHVSVLGDLLGSQWVTDGEFRKRAGRYWHVVMKGLEKVPDSVFGVDEVEQTEEAPVEPSTRGDSDDQEMEEDEDEEEDKKPERKAMWGGTTEVLGADKGWSKRVVNIAGNHDVGYAGDIDESRIERFEKAFGSVNWDIWFTLPDHLRSNHTASGTPPTLRLVILNSMNLDTPAYSSDLQSETYSYMNHIITTSLPVEDKTHATILLTHIPLEKEPGVCVDSPYFDFFEGGQGVKEQNMLSNHASKTVLEGMFGMSSNKDAAGGGQGRRGIIINGHDHAGCDVVHYIRQPGIENACDVNQIKKTDAYWPLSMSNETMMATSMDIDGVDINAAFPLNHTNTDDSDSPEPTPEPTTEPPPPPTWRARAFPPRPFDISPDNTCTSIDASPHVREITLRSMMGDFSGHAGFLSGWFDEDKGEWVFEFASCGLGVQHWWWGIHIVDLIFVGCLIVGGIVKVLESNIFILSRGEKPENKGRAETGKVMYSSTKGSRMEVTEVAVKQHDT